MTPEDEAFDEIARKQGHWGGGFMAKRAMAADKLWDRPSVAFDEWWNSDNDESTNPFRLESGAYWAWAGWKAALAQPPLPVQREWIWLSDADIKETIDSICQYNGDYDEWLCKKIETKIKELNT